MNTRSIIYENIRVVGDKYPRLHLRFVKFLTKIITPVGRIRGLGMIMQIIGKFFYLNNLYTELSLTPSARFCYPTYDSYWAYFVHTERPYENNLVQFLNNISNQNFCFIDCGANYGYWPAIMSSVEFGSHKCLAIEASEESFHILQRTAKLNDERFQCIQKAVFDTSNQTISFADGGRHAGRHVIDGQIENLTVNVPVRFSPPEYISKIFTITLDDIVKQYFPNENSFVIKLDVEGAEINCFDGAQKLAMMDSVFIYEDFGGDPRSEITDYLLKKDYKIYYPNEIGQVTRIFNINKLSSIKKDKRSGYDFVCCKGDGKIAGIIQKLAENTNN